MPVWQTLAVINSVVAVLRRVCSSAKMPGKRPTVKPFSIRPGAGGKKKPTWTRLEDLAQRDAERKVVGLQHLSIYDGDTGLT